MKQKAEITLEVEETVVFRQPDLIGQRFCPNCAEVVEMVAPHAITAMSGITEREIFRLVEAGKIHFVEADRIFVCLSCYQGLLLRSGIDQAHDGG